MATTRDPRASKPNSRARLIESDMRDCWSAFGQNKDFAIRRQSLEKLQEYIVKWLAEPEVVHDVEKGALKIHGQGRERWNKTSPEDAEFPFDSSGEATDSFFYFAYGLYSELMTDATVKADPDCIFNRVAYFVTLVEKLYATPQPTTMHFSSDQAFRVQLGHSSAGPKYGPGRFVVLTDSAGSSDGKVRVAYAGASYEKARARADELAQKFQVRCVVGRVVRSVDTH